MSDGADEHVHNTDGFFDSLLKPNKDSNEDIVRNPYHQYSNNMNWLIQIKSVFSAHIGKYYFGAVVP